MVIVLGDSALTSSSTQAGGQALASELIPHLHSVLASGVELVVTHRGAPLGEEVRAHALEKTADTTAGVLGEALAMSLRAEVSEARQVTSLMAYVSVDPASLGFRRRRQPAGPIEVEPLEILDVLVLRRALESGAVVVAGAGGGIPVVRDGERWCRADAVLDQDLTAAVLADSLDADQLFIVTDVSNVFEDFGTPHEEPIGLISVDELRNLLAEGHFLPGTMAPKVEACVRFVSRPGRRAVICDTTNLERAMNGLAGTRVIWTPPARAASEFEHHVA